ncbi:hypothetical protein FRZ61_37400 [Hypericibacter adhaerens]|jgi:hypothetical protein|uniref:Uncharacterized protein n=1 Tax=Hypericibacter adhaerens TaxID=2602016 RepID=A0A5J6N258_9PROT|nr:hypothetical protein [Hypericibacter adhaerens]QEX23801.1 hypothetical protein FRZ61_37400 [Hypericibacter adhaerens]
MRQQVTLGYFERDEAGRMRACSRAVIVEAESGDEAAAKALAAHGAELERLSGYDPGQATGRVAVLGVDTATIECEAVPPIENATKAGDTRRDARRGTRRR